MKKQNRLILVDGSAYIFRAFYALPPMRRTDGTPVNAVFGFTNMLVKLIEDYREDKLVVIFDAARENFRNKIFSEYKANRGETPEDLVPQFDLIKKSVKAFNVPQLELAGYEADDIIATFVKKAKKQNIQSLIISSDKDLMQLVDDKIEMLDPMKNKKIGIEEVIEKFGVKPNQVTQIQALTGDKVDNIPGAPGIGPKTALELIKQYGNIENLISKSDSIQKEKRRKIIQASVQDIRISLQLVKLENQVKLPFSIENIVPYNQIKENSEEIMKFLLEQGFQAIANRLMNNSFINKDNDSFEIQSKEINAEYITITKTDQLDHVCDQIKKNGACAIDVETDSLNIENANLVGISLCNNLKFSYYLPITHRDLVNKKIYEEQIPENKILEAIKVICKDPSILKIGQNIKYDIRILSKYGIKFESIADTMLMSYALDNGLTRHGMDDLAYKHFNHTTIKFKEIVGTGKKQISFDYVNINKATKYSAEDALITLK